MVVGDNQTVMPTGYVAVEQSRYNAIREDRAIMHNVLDILKAKVLREYVESKKRGWSATMYCTEIADILGIQLPEVKEVIEEKGEEKNEGNNN